jgi:hypothetical protein
LSGQREVRLIHRPEGCRAHFLKSNARSRSTCRGHQIPRSERHGLGPHRCRTQPFRHRAQDHRANNTTDDRATDATGIGAAGEEATDEHADRRRPGTTWPPDPPPDQITDGALAQMRLYPALLVLPAAGVASVAPARARVLATAPADAGGGPRLGTATGNDPSAQAVHVPVFSRDLVNQLPRWGEGNGWHYPGSHLLTRGSSSNT